MKEFGCELTHEEVDIIFAKWDEDDSGNLNFDEFLKEFRYEMSPVRQAAVEEAFSKFDADEITMKEIHEVYNVAWHPKAISGEANFE